MKPGELYMVKRMFLSQEKPYVKIERGEFLIFIRKETDIDRQVSKKYRRYFFLHKERIISLLLGYEPVASWVKKYH